MDRPWIVFGLGNPGPRYASTRHNIGFWVVDRLAARRGAGWSQSPELGSGSWESHALGSPRLWLIKPGTYMNRVGPVAVAACAHLGVGVERLIVVGDDADLTLGRLRVRPGGGAGGHNGLRSLIEALGTDGFARLRLGVRGVGREASDLADYVLEPFAADERDTAEELAELGAQAVEVVVAHGAAEAMNRFNGVRLGQEPVEPPEGLA